MVKVVVIQSWVVNIIQEVDFVIYDGVLTGNPAKETNVRRVYDIKMV